MVLPLKPGFAAPFTEASQSPMTAPLLARRRWLRLLVFIPAAAASVLAVMVAMVIVIELVPALRDRTADSGLQLENTPLRLIEESIQTLMFGGMVGAAAFGLLVAACLVWRRPLKDFLWPGRSFDLRLFGVGFLLVLSIQAAWALYDLASGGPWRPPVLDPYYAADTRILYALAMVGGLLAGAAAEEIIFRGVLLRVTGVLTRRATLLCLINGLLFSAIHLDPDPLSFLIRWVAGMGWTWAALRLGGLEFAIGGHFANNLFIALVWSPFSALIQVREANWISLASELITMVIVVTVVEWLARRRTSGSPVLPARPAA